jgi:HAD superfamily hydrolase (TIGR01509 family)
MSKFKGLIFDMDGLLFDTERLYYQATQEVADSMEIPYTIDIYHRFIGTGDDELFKNYHKMYDSTIGKELVNQFFEKSIQRSVELFEDGQANIKPGVHEVLHYCNINEIPCAIASSNQRSIIDMLLRKNDLHRYFPHIVSFESVSRTKPDPEIFNKAHQLLEIPKEHLLIFEDSKNGILAAEAADIDVVMIPDMIAPTKYLQEKTLAILQSLSEVPDFLNKSVALSE